MLRRDCWPYLLLVAYVIGTFLLADMCGFSLRAVLDFFSIGLGPELQCLLKLSRRLRT